MPVGAIWRRGHKPKVPMGVTYIAVLKDFVLKKMCIRDRIESKRATKAFLASSSMFGRIM